MYHLNKTNGAVGICRATKIPCPFGGTEVHFNTMNEASKSFEKLMSDSSDALYSMKKVEQHEATTPNSRYFTPAAFAGSRKELEQEILLLRALLNEPKKSAEEEQLKLDGELEARITSVGLALAEEAELRVGIDREAIKNSPMDSESRKVLIAEAVENLTSAHKELIAELRPVGGILTLANTPDKGREAAQKILNETVERDYPTTWLDASNASGDRLRLVGIGNDRASYGNGTPQPDLSPKDYPQFSQTRPEYSYYIPVPEDELAESLELLGERAKVIDAPSYLEGGKPTRVISMPMELVYEKPMETEPNTNPNPGEPNFKPKGEGWEWSYYIDGDIDKVSKKKNWVKPSKDVEKVYMDMLRVGHPETNSEGPTPSNYRRTAYHEFGHRVERTVANGAIMRMEHAFLKRRTTDARTGEQEEISYVYPPRAGQSFLSVERGRRGDFIEHYMGKEYVDSPAREVFTVGLESVFGGSYEALSGISETRTNDKDMKGFILGLLATA